MDCRQCLILLFLNIPTSYTKTTICNCLYQEHTLDCSGLDDNLENCDHQVSNEDKEITTLILSNSTFALDTSIHRLLTIFNLNPNQIISLAIQDTNISSVSLTSLVNLEYLDLRNNKLSTLKEPVSAKIKKLFLSGNPWTCFVPENTENWTFSFLDHGMHMAWLIKSGWSRNWMDQEDTKCAKLKSIKSEQIKKHIKRNNKEKDKEGGFQLKKFLSLAHNTSRSCPGGCICGIAREQPLKLEPPYKHSLVCSGINLSKMPGDIPPHTIALDISNNRIQELEQLNSTAYKYLKKLNLSGNLINTFEGFQSTNFFLKHGRKRFKPLQGNEPILDLSHNSLTNLPYWLYSSQLHSMLYLLGNPWSCSCNLVKHFISFHHLNTHLLPDGDLLDCKDLRGTLTDLTMREECQPGETDPLLVVIGFEIILLLMIGIQFYRDWKMYYTTRKLPWISRNLPGWLTKGF